MIRFISEHKIAFLTVIIVAILMVFEILHLFHKPEWEKHQLAYYSILKSKAGTAEEKNFLDSRKPEIFTLDPEHGFNSENCISCHIGYADKRLEGNPVPVSYHSGMSGHAFDEFGCVSCHEGYGAVLEKSEAHGGIEGRITGIIPAKFFKSSCIRCHDISDLPKDISEKIQSAKNMLTDLYCSDCHRYNNQGSPSGFDLGVLGNHKYYSIKNINEHFETTREVLNSRIREKNAQNKSDDIEELEEEIEKLTDEEHDDLVFLLIGLYNNPKERFLVRRKSFPYIRRGKELVSEHECFGCHSLKGKGGETAPDLLNVTYRRSADWIKQHLVDPSIIREDSGMTKFSLSDEDINEIYKYLSTLKDPLAAFSRQKFLTPVEKGRAVYLKYNCSVCHGVNGEGGVLNPNSIAKYISPLLFVKEGYSKDEMKKFILNGNTDITKLKPDGPDPFFVMPAFKNIISDKEISWLVDYLISLYHEKSGSEEDDW